MCAGEADDAFSVAWASLVLETSELVRKHVLTRPATKLSASLLQLFVHQTSSSSVGSGFSGNNDAGSVGIGASGSASTLTTPSGSVPATPTGTGTGAAGGAAAFFRASSASFAPSSSSAGGLDLEAQAQASGTVSWPDADTDVHVRGAGPEQQQQQQQQVQPYASMQAAADVGPGGAFSSAAAAAAGGRSSDWRASVRPLLGADAKWAAIERSVLEAVLGEFNLLKGVLWQYDTHLRKVFRFVAARGSSGGGAVGDMGTLDACGPGGLVLVGAPRALVIRCA
jgi:hypothetical protein